MARYYRIKRDVAREYPSSLSRLVTSRNMHWIFHPDIIFYDKEEKVTEDSTRTVTVGQEWEIKCSWLERVSKPREVKLIHFKKEGGRVRAVSNVPYLSGVQHGLGTCGIKHVTGYDYYPTRDTFYMPCDEHGNAIRTLLSGAPSTNKLDEEARWSELKSKVMNFNKDYLREQIRSRYAFIDRPQLGLSNVIVDTFFPRLLYVHNMNVTALKMTEIPRLPKTSVAISPLIGNLLNIKTVPTEELCRVLGYTTKNIKDLLVKVKKKKLTFVFAGTGGTGMNTAYWLSEMCQFTSTVNLFKQVYAYEKEDLEVSNLLRFPIDVNSSKYAGLTNTKKLNMALPLLQPISKNDPILVERYIGDNNYFPHDIYTKNDKNEYEIRPNTVVYGAPSLESRDILSRPGGFIAGTHADISCHIWLNPKQDLDMQVESYGMIQLGSFFMNQLRMAIGLLEFLARDDVNYLDQDVQVMDYSFDGTIQLPTSRTYNWQIESEARMMTEEESMNV
jgi:hypothetical protein